MVVIDTGQTAIQSYMNHPRRALWEGFLGVVTMDPQHVLYATTDYARNHSCCAAYKSARTNAKSVDGTMDRLLSGTQSGWLDYIQVFTR